MTHNEERAAIVAWLREQSHALDRMAAEDAYGLQARADYKTSAINMRASARAIERGDHLKTGDKR